MKSLKAIIMVSDNSSDWLQIVVTPLKNLFHSLQSLFLIHAGHCDNEVTASLSTTFLWGTKDQL